MELKSTTQYLVPFSKKLIIYEFDNLNGAKNFLIDLCENEYSDTYYLSEDGLRCLNNKRDAESPPYIISRSEYEKMFFEEKD